MVAQSLSEPVNAVDFLLELELSCSAPAAMARARTGRPTMRMATFKGESLPGPWG